jgi:type I restriction enzyme S subunit
MPPLQSYLQGPPRYGIGASAVPWDVQLPAYIRITDIDQHSRFRPDPAVSVADPRASNYSLVDGDLVVARTGASVGKSYRYRPADGALVFAGFLMAVRPDPNVLDPDYLSLVFQSRHYWNWITSESMRSGQPGINARQLAQLEISPPSIAEQRAVAAAVQRVDDLINALERLIAKKFDVKQGMMQELLTGRTRLPGFAGGWSKVRLGDVLTVRHGRDQKAVEVADGRYKILATGGQIGTTNTTLYSNPSVLIGRKGTIDRPQFQNEPFWSVDTLFYTEIRDGADPKYLFYVFQTVDWRSMNEASGVPSLTSGRVESVEVDLPTVDEQRAIRTVLDDADAEITALERRLESARAVKGGMMHELMAGCTRFPAKEEA